MGRSVQGAAEISNECVVRRLGVLGLMGRGRALEVLLSADDYDADLAERYGGWVNRSVPAGEIDEFVRNLAKRIAAFPAEGHAAVKERANAISLAPPEDFRRDSDLFGESARRPEVLHRLQAALSRGFQTREAELTLAQWIGNPADPRSGG